MTDPNQSRKEEGDQTGILLAQYQFASENRNSADAVAWEMTAITWGGQTLLLGFALEAIDHSSAQPLIPFVAALGVVLSLFCHKVMSSRRSVADEMIKICNEIETAMAVGLQPQHRIDAVYPRKKQTRWFLVVNYTILALWILVALRAIELYCSATAAR